MLYLGRLVRGGVASFFYVSTSIMISIMVECCTLLALTRTPEPLNSKLLSRLLRDGWRYISIKIDCCTLLTLTKTPEPPTPEP